VRRIKQIMHTPDFAAQLPWIALNMARTLWPALHTQCVRHLATPGVVQRLCAEGITAFDSMAPGTVEKLATIQQNAAFTRELDQLHKTPITVLTLIDPAYPHHLRWISDPPLVLYIRGATQPEDHLALAVVGTRKPSNYGKAMAQRLSAELVQHGFTVVSGLARGIDSVAHQSALQAGGRTLAVLGSGINVLYPPENRRLFETISDRGAVLSEFPLDTKPDRWNFPRRNRIISGLALGTLVVEAAVSSGALLTARHALEQGREVFAVPGRVDVPSSHGTHRLIKSGAKLVEGIEDILEEFPDLVRQSSLRQPETARQATPSLEELSADEGRILALLQPEETHIDTLIQGSQLPAQVVASILVTLELRGLIRQFPGKFFVRLYPC
jgi:DNA processing protein